ncbi:hypothetical protein [Umezawaea beigongshangensis]|uniref:hypothetical protein n=1 Tax=Umezawaea beigongshangensis TaxID=2780383 RepID=UPI0018F204FA|nr:hypothetical protein [Umezawaea beigongshangensis]
MDATSYSPDGLTSTILRLLDAQVSVEIAQSAAPTSALLDGTALERRNRRIAGRALAGITARYGVSLVQAQREAEVPVLPLEATIPAPVFGKVKRVGRKARREAARAAAARSGVGRVA